MHISGLYIYPIKSCRGTALQCAELSVTGLLHDRRWMLVDERGKFVTQREQPRMALIEPSLHDSHASHAALIVSAPGMSDLHVAGETCERTLFVKVWNDVTQAFDEGAVAAKWFSDFLGISVRLVRFDDAIPRLSNHVWTGELDAPNHFSDGFPLLMISQASLDDLNARLSEPLPINRFRPNIVVEGLPAYGEDELRDVMVGAVRLRAVKPCTRCKITTTDQATGIAQGQQPLVTLMQYRHSTQLRGVIFGQNMVIVRGVGSVLQVGQPLVACY